MRKLGPQNSSGIIRASEARARIASPRSSKPRANILRAPRTSARRTSVRSTSLTSARQISLPIGQQIAQALDIKFRERTFRAHQIPNAPLQHRPRPNQIAPRLMMERDRQLHQPLQMPASKRTPRTLSPRILQHLMRLEELPGIKKFNSAPEALPLAVCFDHLEALPRREALARPRTGCSSTRAIEYTAFHITAGISHPIIRIHVSLKNRSY